MKIRNLSDRKILFKHFQEKSRTELVHLLIDYVPIEVLTELLNHLKEQLNEQPKADS